MLTIKHYNVILNLRNKKVKGKVVRNMEDIITDTIALRVKMAKKGYKTIISLAEKADIDRNTLSKVLDGETQPSTTIMKKLVSALDLEPQEAGEIFFAKELT